MKTICTPIRLSLLTTMIDHNAGMVGEQPIDGLHMAALEAFIAAKTAMLAAMRRVTEQEALQEIKDRARDMAALGGEQDDPAYLSFKRTHELILSVAERLGGEAI